MPTRKRLQSAQMLTVGSANYLLDAGENVQQSIMLNDVKRSKINAIFISHLHPDHYIGLIGLLCSMGLQGRGKELNIVGPKGIDDIINVQLTHSKTVLPYPIHYLYTSGENGDLVFEDSNVSVELLKLNHRIECSGFLFKQKPSLRPLNIEKAKIDKVPTEAFRHLKNGEDFTSETGEVFKWNEYTFRAQTPLRYAYCTDTTPVKEIIPFIEGCDMLYHDSTFMHNLWQKALDTHHSTSLQAAEMAKAANVKRLLIGHFSSRYDELEPMLAEAKTIFPETELAHQGTKFSIKQTPHS